MEENHIDLGTTTLNNLTTISGIETVATAVLGLYIFLRILSIIWVSRDIHARSNSLVVQIFAIILVTCLSPIIGLPLYITMRPVRYKAHK